MKPPSVDSTCRLGFRAESIEYRETLECLFSLHRCGRERTLSRMENYLRKLGSPQERMGACAIITGTNGKGSVAAMLSSVLVQSGYRTGLYTSPHLHRFNERIRVNGEPIDDADVVQLARHVLETTQALNAEESMRCMAFEIFTLMAFTYFKQQETRAAVVEVGIGGRLDATNVTQPIVAVITNVDLEHTEALGPTRARIAWEKSHVIKPGCIPIIGDLDRDSLHVVTERCEAVGTAPWRLGKEIRVTSLPLGQVRVVTPVGEHVVHVPFLGSHQIVNCALAVAAADGLSAKGILILDDYLCSGIANAKWAGRLEMVRQWPPTLVDVAHNVHGVRAIANFLSTEFAQKEVTLIAGASWDKPYSEMIPILTGPASTVILTRAKYKGADPQILLPFVSPSVKKTILIPSLEEALSVAQTISTSHAILVSGGLYLAAEAREILLRKSGRTDLG